MVVGLKDGSVLKNNCLHCGNFCRVDELEKGYLFICTRCEYAAYTHYDEGVLDKWDVDDTLEMEV